MYPQNSEHGISVSQFLRVQLSSPACQTPLSGMCEAVLAYSAVTADTGGLLCEAGTFHGKLQRPQSHTQDVVLTCHLVVTFSLHWVQMNGTIQRTKATSTAHVDVT